jgi:uncharacterized cupredoxin-like copper-binding protein
MRHERTARAAAGAAVLLALTGAASGCGGTAGAGLQAPVVDVHERDFRITVSRTHLPPGTVVFRAINSGPDSHELIVVRSDRARLRLRADGMTVDEAGLQRAIVGTLEPAPAGAKRELRVTLRAGTYTLLCNMYGHYMGGMHSTVVVR